MTLDQEKDDLRQRVMSFAHDNLSGTYPASIKMKQAMQRFVNDVEKAEKGESSFYIDWKELVYFSRWASMFKHTKGVLAGEHIELHITQLWEAANIFCFKRRSDNTRRFREVYIQKARKNARILALG